VAVKSTDWTKEGGKYVPKASNFLKTGTYRALARKVDAAEPKTVYWKPDWETEDTAE
jgi:hypothetical protein